MGPGEMAVLAALGAAAGFASTLFGIGGGLVMVPLLHYALGIDFVTATSLSLVAMAAQTPIGAWSHARRRAVSWRLGALLAVGGAAGVAAGVALQPRTPIPLLKLLLAALMALAAWRLVRPLRERAGHVTAAPLALAIGGVAGLASRLLGIGGGLLTVPLLALGGTPIHAAVASSLVPVFSNAALAAAVALAQGLDALPAIPLALGAVATAPLGARAAHALHAPGLRRAFAAALALAALYVAATSGG